MADMEPEEVAEGDQFVRGSAQRSTIRDSKRSMIKTNIKLFYRKFLFLVVLLQIVYMSILNHL